MYKIPAVLQKAYLQYYELPLGGKKIHTPYRLNSPYQPDRRKYGKSNPIQLVADTKQIAQELGFDLENADELQIRRFMEENLLGIDCSGYAYYLLDFLLITTGQGSMEEQGFPPTTKTNVQILTSDEYTITVPSISDIQPGDLIKFNKNSVGTQHVIVIMDKTPEQIIYTHSSGLTETTGVHQDVIKITAPNLSLKDQIWPEKLREGGFIVDYFNPNGGDGIRRLKILQ